MYNIKDREVEPRTLRIQLTNETISLEDTFAQSEFKTSVRVLLLLRLILILMHQGSSSPVPVPAYFMNHNFASSCEVSKETTFEEANFIGKRLAQRFMK